MNRYLPFREELYSDDIGAYVSYGIRVLDSRGQVIASVSDVSVDKDLVDKLCYLWTRYELSPIHLEDAIEEVIS